MNMRLSNMKFWTWILVWTMVATPLTPYAQPRSEELPDVERKSGQPTLLEDAIRLFEDLEWQASVETFNAVLDTGSNVADNVHAYWYLMLLSHAFGNRQETEEFLFQAFRLKPDLEPLEPLRDPILKEIFNGISTRVDRTAPKVSILPIDVTVVNEEILVVIEILDDSPLVEVKLIHELSVAGETGLVKMKAAKANRWSAEIPASATTRPGEFQFEVIVQDDWQNTTIENGKFAISSGSTGSRMVYLVRGAVVAFGGGIAALLLGQFGKDDSSSRDTWPKSKPPGHPQTVE